MFLTLSLSLFFRFDTKGDPFKTMVHKAIYVLKEFEGKDVFILAMHTQEFYSRSKANNKIYISTLDSIQLFKPTPKQLRGECYREVITAYLEFKRNHG